MKAKFTVLLLTVLATSTLASEMLKEISPERAQVEGEKSQPQTVRILTIENPGITKKRYAITGEVRYRDVEGKGYLEMWGHFPGGGRYFSRTLGSETLQPLKGSSDFRYFVLPFFMEAQTPPEKLVVNIVLPGSGTVEVRQLRLFEYEQNENPLQVPGQWWSERMAGIIGGTLGGIIGCLGALCGLLSSRGKARTFVLGYMKVLIMFGVASLLLGIYAVIKSQPYAVYYPLLLFGVIVVAVVGGMFRNIRRRYTELELRKMQSLDA